MFFIHRLHNLQNCPDFVTMFCSNWVDFVTNNVDKRISIEIKSGSSGSLKSLHQFIDQTNHPNAVRIYAREFRIEKNIAPKGKQYLLMNLPYYLGTKITEYVQYFVENYKP